MKKEYDFSKGRRGAVVRQSGKTRITIYIDTDILDTYRAKAETEGCGYQTLINATLRASLGEVSRPVDEETLRRVIREEMSATK